MLERVNRRFASHLLVVDDNLLEPETAHGRSIRGLVNELKARGVAVIEAVSFEDGLTNIIADASIHCVMVNWSLGSDTIESHEEALRLLRTIRHRREFVPIFLLADRRIARSTTVEVMEMVNEFVWMLEDAPTFIAGRVIAAMERYLDTLLPPFAAALLRHNHDREYSWAAPGHQGGVAFTKSPVGRLLYDFFGENLFRTDVGIERTALGSLLDHTGPIADSEIYAAQVFGAHRTYSGTNGTSGSNRAVLAACINENELTLCDRNCHKSIEQGLSTTGGIPVYFVPMRNRYGIIGPIPPSQFTPAAIAANIAANPLSKDAASQQPVFAVVTNCTYDGLAYDARRAQELLEQSVDRILFDEAWFAYARFNDLYRDRFAMRGDPADHPKDGPTVFVTQSTHKLLAALSQATFIHVRDGRRPIPHGVFNEAYCAQASTSPLYPILAANDIATAMMDRQGGIVLTSDAIREAVDCRQAIDRLYQELAARGEWFFAPWNPPTVTDPATGKRVPFHQASPDLLSSDPNCWVLHPGEPWHGFGDIEDGWCLLDPTKFGIVCPGMKEDGDLAESGIPAALLTAYLTRNAIVPSRTTDHMVLFLFSIGITKGKWGTLINTLLDFKWDYDHNAPVADVAPDVVKVAPRRYRRMGLRDLGNEMWAHMKESRQAHWQAAAFSQLPTLVTTPRKAYQRLVAGDAELLPLEETANRVAAIGVIPYPPGIPVVMPGENIGPADGPWLNYIRTLQAWDHRFPGFETEVEGVETHDGVFHIYCLKSP